MKKSKLRNIIKESIKELVNEHQHPVYGDFAHHVDPNNPSYTIDYVYGNGIQPLMGDGTHTSHYKANICPAMMAVHHTGLPIGDVANWYWINDQYSQAGIATLGPAPTPNPTTGLVPPNTQMFDCFQVHPVAEPWFQPWTQPTNPNGSPPLGNGTFADLPVIMGQYANIQQGIQDGWLMPGPIGQCNIDCEAMAVNYDDCEPPPGGCPDFQTPWGPVGTIWQPFPHCTCLSPSVGPGNTTGVLHDPTLTHSTMSIDNPVDLNCECCKGGYAVGMTPIPSNTQGGCASWNGTSAGSYILSNCAETGLFDPRDCKEDIELLKCTCCDDNNPGLGLSPNPPIPLNTPGGCSSWNGPYAGTNLSNCAESNLWNSSNCPQEPEPCDSWIDPGFQGGTCCEWCNNIGWPVAAPTNVSCGGIGTGGGSAGVNNWFCGCCDPYDIAPTKFNPSNTPMGYDPPPYDKFDVNPIDKMELNPQDKERFIKLANIKR